MKQTIKLLVLLLTVGMATSTYAAIGTHNALISVGGGLNYFTTAANDKVYSPLTGILEGLGDIVGEEATALGGGYIIELGYLYLKDTGNFVHGVDTRLSFGQNFNGLSSVNGGTEIIDAISDAKASVKFNSLYVQVGTTYQFGFKTSGGRLMLDVLGLNLGYLSGTFAIKGPKEADADANYKTGSSFLIGINLPLGVNYIFDSGFMIGFRHRLDIAMGGKVEGTTDVDGDTYTPESGTYFGSDKTQLSYLAYNLAFSIGFAFGK